jgi:hypothetical protein
MSRLRWTCQTRNNGAREVPRASPLWSADRLPALYAGNLTLLVPFRSAASSTQSQRLSARQAPSQLIRPPRIAEHELASENRFVRFQTNSCRRTRRSAASRPQRRCSLPAVTRPIHGNFKRRRLMPAVGAYARPLARSRKAAAAIHRDDFRRRVFVVRVTRALLAV